MVCRPTTASPTRTCEDPGAPLEACVDTTSCAPGLICSSSSHLCKVDDGDTCVTSAECLEQRHCIQVTATKTECLLPQTLLGSQCQSDSHCGANLTCDDEPGGSSTCLRSAGSPCGDNADACVVSTLCFNQKCEPLRGVGEPCQDDALCLSGECLGSGVCAAGKLGPNQACTENDDCVSDRCTLTKCQ